MISCLKKLFAYGIRGTALKLLESYLTDRTKYVIYDGMQSTTLPISCGVPQGSILGPLLFIITMNDIGNVSEFLYTILYADDTCVLLNLVRSGGGGLLNPPPKFYPHAFKCGATLLCVGDLSQKIVLHRVAKKNFDEGSKFSRKGGGVSKFKVDVIFIIFRKFNITLEIVDS